MSMTAMRNAEEDGMLRDGEEANQGRFLFEFARDLE
jgi:hypothetical protein